MNESDGVEPGNDPIADDERKVLADVRSLLDQLRLDANHELSLDSNLSNDLGIDSLALVELCDLLERSFDVTLPDEVFLTATTPREWLASILAANGTAGDSASPQAPREESRGARAGVPTPSILKRVTEAALALRRHLRASRDDTKEYGPGGNASHPIEWLRLFSSWLLLAPFALTIWMLAVLPLPLHTRRDVARYLARGLCRALGISMTLEGSLPTSDEPFLVTANHASFIDGLVLYVVVPEPLVFVSSVEIARQPFLGRIARNFGCLFVERGRAERSAASVDMLVDAVNEGKRLAIFPEGSLSMASGLRVFHLGAFEAATSAHCAVVPIGIQGTRNILRAGTYRPSPGAVRVVIGTPISPVGTDFSARVALRDEVRAAIAALSGESTIATP